jgi:hypothetical protein
VGVANETVDNSGGSAGDKSILVNKAGSFVFKANSFVPAVGDLGKEAYAATNWEVQVTTVGLTTQYKIGTVTAVENSSSGDAGVRVRIDNYTL